MTTECLALPAKKLEDPESLTQSQLTKIFGDAELINTSQKQEELELDDAEGNGVPKIVRQVDQIDLAFFESHEFAVLRDHGDPAEIMGAAPYRIEPDAKNDKSDGPFETNDLLELYDELMVRGSKGITLQRYKGLGEMNAEQLKVTTMDPGSRRLLRVSADDEAKASDTFQLLMGDQVEPRKEFIQKHAADVRNLDT
jgi:DNA gyrase subunit B